MPSRYFGDYVRKIMAERGLRASHLAELSGVSAAHVGKLLQGDRRPRPSTVSDLAKALGAEFEVLMAYVEADRVADVPGDLDSRVLKQIDENETAMQAILDDPDRLNEEYDELSKLDELVTLGMAMKKQAGQLRVTNQLNAELRARLEESDRKGDSGRSNVRLPFHGKVGRHEHWPLKPRLARELPSEVAALGDFAVEVATTALDRVPIVPGDVLVARHELSPADGQVVLVRLPDDRTTCLRYRLFDGCALLLPESHDPVHQPIPVNRDATPFAVATFVFRPGAALP